MYENPLFYIFCTANPYLNNKVPFISIAECRRKFTWKIVIVLLNLAMSFIFGASFVSSVKASLTFNWEEKIEKVCISDLSIFSIIRAYPSRRAVKSSRLALLSRLLNSLTVERVSWNRRLESRSSALFLSASEFSSIWGAYVKVKAKNEDTCSWLNCFYKSQILSIKPTLKCFTAYLLIRKC